MEMINSKKPADSILQKFEDQHPGNLGWDLEVKKAFIREKNSKAFYLKINNRCIAELLISWNSDNVFLVNSITVLPEYRNNGYSKKLLKHGFEWALDNGFELCIGEARIGASWNAFKSFGAKSIFIHKNWCKSKENYVSFLIKLKK